MATVSMTDALLAMLDEAYNGPAWHGPHLHGAVRRLGAAEAAWRPGPGRHNIAEITVHAAYWKYAVRRRLRGDKRGSFALKGSNWFRLPDPLSEEQWQGYLDLLDAEHARLREAVSRLTPKQLAGTPRGGKVSYQRLVAGIAMHDVYHTGQIQTIKALHKHQSPATTKGRRAVGGERR